MGDRRRHIRGSTFQTRRHRKQVHDPIPRNACPALCRNGVAATRASNVIRDPSESRVPHCGTQGATMPIHQSCWACWAHALRWQDGTAQGNQPSDIAAWTNHSKVSAACFLFSAALVIGGYDVLVVLQLVRLHQGLGIAGAGGSLGLSRALFPAWDSAVRPPHAVCRTRRRKAVTAHDPSLYTRVRPN